MTTVELLAHPKTTTTTNTSLDEYRFTWKLKLEPKDLDERLYSPDFCAARILWSVYLRPEGNKIGLFLILKHPTSFSYEVSYKVTLTTGDQVFTSVDYTCMYGYATGWNWGCPKITTKDALCKSLKSSPDVTISILLSVQNQVSGSGLVRDISKLLLDADSADISFKFAKESTVAAHSFILSLRSPVFKAMFSSVMKETMSRTVDIEDATIEAFKIFLYYIYNDHVAPADFKKHKSDLLILANKYEVRDLHRMCEEHYQNKISVKNACKRYSYSEKFNMQILKYTVSSFIKSNIKDVLLSAGFKELILMSPALALDVHNLSG